MQAFLERDTRQLAKELAARGADLESRVFKLSFLNDRLLEWAMTKPDFRTKLFQLVDVLPATAGAGDVADHVQEYLGVSDAPAAVRALIKTSGRLPAGDGIVERVATSNVERMAEQFIAGTTTEEAVAAMRALWKDDRAHTVDILGEKTIVPADADAYAERVTALLVGLTDDAATWRSKPRLEEDDLGSLPRVNISIKPTALATHYDPLGAPHGVESAKARIRPILRLAAERNAFIFFDMEHGDVKDLTLRCFRELLDEDEFATTEAGIAVQAYRTDSRDDLAELVGWSATRAAPITVRLVKGAYWDTETIDAEANDWPAPVYLDKDETDANFERCVRLLHDHHGVVRAAFGSHNLRSLAYAAVYARSVGIPDNGYEFQLLHGMAEPIHHALVACGFRLRVYAPVGELVPGMAYLVRRLLENTSNESFVRHRFAEGQDLDALLRRPDVDSIPDPVAPEPRLRTSADEPTDYRPEPLREFRRPAVLDGFAGAVGRQRIADVTRVPALIDGDEVSTTTTIERRDPADPNRTVSVSASCDERHVDQAVAAAVAAAESWRLTPAPERAALLFRTAHRMRRRRDDLAARQVFEAGKPWDQSDADVCEAIDFCEYYARELLALDARVGAQSAPGERNRLTYQGKGPTAVIAPWNFPLAIPTGMTVASIAAGNPTILKPAEQTPSVAWDLAEALRDAGAPPGVFQLLPGPGEVVGAGLVDHPDIATIVFTGSRNVGLGIMEQAAKVRPGQRHIKKVIAELGGKNALIIDADADPDQAIPGAVYSAFGFSGQKCSATSRLLVHRRIFDETVSRLGDAVRDLVIGHPADQGVTVGPLIDDEAAAKSQRYIDQAHAEGTVVVHRNDLPDRGSFVGPTVVTDLADDSAVMCDEIFGPVLAVRPFDDLDEAIAFANSSEYALTGGIYTRTPSHIDAVAQRLRAGNIYVNRPTTGAVVGRQPFGGYGLSGIGSKAGGPDYLLQFLDPRVVSENTVRQGFAAD